jgi:hypothetical protein
MPWTRRHRRTRPPVFLQFPRVAAVAHHCGAGTTAQGLRAGVPTIALPAFGDGPFWAALVVSAVESLLHPSKNLKLREHNAHKCFKRR